MQSVNKKSENKGNSNDESVETMLDFNALQYDMYPDLSVVVDRTTKTSYPQKSSYKFGETMHIYLNTGSDFIDTQESYFVFDLKLDVEQEIATQNYPVGAALTDTPEVSWGKSGSAYNIIEEILITDRSGNELERIRDVNRLANILLRYNRTSDYLSRGGTVCKNDSYGDLIPWIVDKDVKSRWCLSLKHISGLFDYNQLLPSQLMSGMRIEIKFATIDKAFKWEKGTTTTVPFTFTVENPRLQLVSVKLTDSIMRELNRRSAKNGLEIMYRTWYRDFTNVANVNVNFESRKAVSRAFGAIAQFVDITSTVADERARDSMESKAFDLVEWQWRAGNLYFPNQKLVGETPALLGVETFVHAQKFFGKNKHLQYDNAVSVSDYNPNTRITTQRSNDDYKGYTDKGSQINIIPVDLERTTVQDLSGIPLNNSRVLAFNGKLQTSPGVGDTGMFLFLNHLKVARVFMENTEVEE